MLIKPTIIQLGSASLNKILGLFITAYLYRLYTLEEIGEKFDLTRERVRQIKEKALRRLRKSSKSKILKSYLG